jgi:hypothetical protein
MEDEHPTVEVIPESDYVTVVCTQCGRKGVAYEYESDDMTALAEERLFVLPCDT